MAEGQDIDLLIGQDNSEALIPLEVRKGEKGEPFACRTIFGWALNGPAKSCGQLNQSVVSHFISANVGSVEDKLNLLWEIECGDQIGKALSQEDAEVERLWDDQTKLVDGHYKFPIPFRKDVPFPNNCKLASSRLAALHRKLDKDDLFSRYQIEISKLSQEGYAEVVPECEIDKSEWEKTSCDISLAADAPEVKQASKVVSVATCVSSVSDDPLQRFFENFSDWNRLKRSVGWMLRLKDLLRKEKVIKGDLTFDEIKRAEIAVFKFVQGQCYDAEIQSLSKRKPVERSSSLKDLSPFLDGDGLVKIGGRLKNSSLHHTQKHPYIIPHQHHVALLLVRHYHEIAHLGCEWVVSQLRQKYWITRVRSCVKKVRNDCMRCRKLFNAPCLQQMASLPVERLDPHKPPFTFTGVDCFGPFVIKRGRSEVKRYGCIYTCLTTRAIHIEKLDSMDTDSFLNGFRRFVSRRGIPEKVFSDNGSNFIGGWTELQKSFQQLSQSKIARYALAKGFEWKFIPPAAPHMGGIWERMVRTVKKVLMGMTEFNCRLNDESLTTFLCEAENIVNSRPITKLSEDVNDSAPLSPNHLLLLRECPSIPPGVFQAADLYKKRWRVVQFMVGQFWRRFLHEYLPELQRRNKWLHVAKNLKVGDLVLLVEENTPRGVWPMGLVQEVYEGGDGLVRSVKIKTKSTVLIRPIVKCVFLEASGEAH